MFWYQKIIKIFMHLQMEAKILLHISECDFVYFCRDFSSWLNEPDKTIQLINKSL